MEIPDRKARADLEDEFRKTIGQLLGGAAVLIGAGLTWFQWQGTQQTTRDQIGASLKSSNDQSISQQVAKGFELLGDDKGARRLGGIYALEGIMNHSEQYHQPVLEALCAFVRDNARVTVDKAVVDKDKTAAPQPPATDIQAAPTVIGRRAEGPGYVDLNEADVSRANLIDANLTGAYLSDAIVSQTQLDMSCGDKDTKLPSGLTIKSCL